MISALTHQGLIRSSNEDVAVAHAIPGGGALLAVADGVGGNPGGELASQLAVDTILETLGASWPPDPPAALRHAFREANRRIKRLQTGAFALMSTTLVTALVRDGVAWVANVGDSRAYIATAGVLRQVSVDHSWVEEQIRAGRLTADDPAARSRRNLITRSVGSEDGVDADVFADLTLARDDALLLCSDGLHALVPVDEIARALSAPGAGVADRLVQLALAYGGADNVAVALYARGD